MRAPRPASTCPGRTARSRCCRSRATTSRSPSSTRTGRTPRCPATGRASRPRGSCAAPARRRRACTSGRETVAVRRTEDGLYESELGPVEVGPPELVDGVELIPVSVGNPHAVVAGDPSRIGELGPRLEAHPRFPERTNVQVARVDAARRGHRPRVGTRRGGDRGIRDERRRGRGRDARRRGGRSSTSPAATCACASPTAGRGSPGLLNRSTNCQAPATKPAPTRSGFPDIVADEGGGELPRPWVGVWLGGPPESLAPSGADLELAQHVVQRHPVVRLVTPAHDQRRRQAIAAPPETRAAAHPGRRRRAAAPRRDAPRARNRSRR